MVETIDDRWNNLGHSLRNLELTEQIFMQDALECFLIFLQILVLHGLISRVLIVIGLPDLTGSIFLMTYLIYQRLYVDCYRAT